MLIANSRIPGILKASKNFIFLFVSEPPKLGTISDSVVG